MYDLFTRIHWHYKPLRPTSHIIVRRSWKKGLAKFRCNNSIRFSCYFVHSANRHKIIFLEKIDLRFNLKKNKNKYPILLAGIVVIIGFCFVYCSSLQCVVHFILNKLFKFIFRKRNKNKVPFSLSHFLKLSISVSSRHFLESFWSKYLIHDWFFCLIWFASPEYNLNIVYLICYTKVIKEMDKLWNELSYWTNKTL